jgi:hypothetical protein
MFRTAIAGILGVFVGFFAFSSLSVSSREEDLYSKFVTIEGSVKASEPETGKVFIPVGQTLIFQRVDCKKCLLVAVTDEEGNYKLRVGEGKYKLIVKGDTSRGGSYLDPTQPETVDAKNKVTSNVFDIKLIRPRNPLDIKKL